MQIPPPLEVKDYPEFDSKVANDILPKMIPRIASDLNIPKNQIINQFEVLGGASFSRKDLFCAGIKDKGCCDGIHPEDKGHKVLAKTVYEALF